MNTRSFAPVKAVRGEEVLSTGLMGPPGGGKTWSALELATGMQRVRGGEIILGETEGRRAMKIAPYFDFLRVPLEPPYTSGLFLDFILEMEKRNPACIIVDCLSDEHEGPGGMLDQHSANLEKTVERARARNDSRADWQIMEAANQSAWIEPKRERLKFILAMDRFAVPVIYTFRAREKVKTVRNEKGKMAPTNVGYQPIAPVEIVHKLDLTCLLPANARGVPMWKSNVNTEDFFIKLPEYLAPYIRRGKRIDDKLGEGLARWMKNDVLLTGDALEQAAVNAADQGMDVLLRWFKTRTVDEKKEIKPKMESHIKKRAADADARLTADGEPPTTDEPATPPPAAAEGQDAGKPDPWLEQYDKGGQAAE